MMELEEILKKIDDYFNNDQLDDIINLIEDNINDYPDNEILYFNLALAYFTKENFEKSEELFDKVLEIDENNSMAYYYKSSLAKNNEDALLNIDKAIFLDEKNVDFLNFKSMILVNLKRFDDAVDVLTDAISIINNSEILYYNLSNVYKLKNDYENALISINKAIAIEPDLHNFWAEKSIIEANSNDLDSAIISSKRAWSLKRDSVKYEVAYKALNGLQCFINKDYQNAINYFEEIVELDPTNQNLSYLAKSKMKAGEFEESLDIFNKILENNPENVTLIMEKANLLKILGREKEAIKEYQNYAKVVRKNKLEEHYDLAEALEMHYPIVEDL